MDNSTVRAFKFARIDQNLSQCNHEGRFKSPSRVLSPIIYKWVSVRAGILGSHPEEIGCIRVVIHQYSSISEARKLPKESRRGALPAPIVNLGCGVSTEEEKANTTVTHNIKFVKFSS